MSLKISEIQKFVDTIDSTQNIVITSHLYPDHDAVCSAVLLARTLKFNLPNKHIQVVLEDKPKHNDIIDSHEIKTAPIIDYLQSSKTDCLILTDTYSLSNVTRGEQSQISAFIKKHKIKTIVIDHHDHKSSTDFDVCIQNADLPSATQLVYQICFNQLGVNKPANISQITMLGMVDDSGFFTYPYNYTETFPIVTQLIKDEASIARAASVINRLTIEQVSIVAELASNMKLESNYCYSFVSDQFVQDRLPADYCPGDFKAACTSFGNRYITAITGADWGFIVYPSLVDYNKTRRQYRASFRSKPNTQIDISVIARSLGASGGHKHAAGASIEAISAVEALSLVRRHLLSAKTKH